jgi:hypothetical protein
MTFRNKLLAALAVGLLASPVAAAAQSWGGYGGDYRGDYGYRQDFRGYPEFQGLKSHIRQEIREGLSEGWLDRGQGRDMYRRLDWVQRREQREFREHGWRLPEGDRDQIRSMLNQIDRSIDEARDEGDNGY